MVNHRIEGHTAVLTIDNPPANTWTPESLRGLEKLVGELHADRAVYAAVITGAGAKFFGPDEISRRPAQLHAPGLGADLARQGKALARIHACETEALCSSPLGHLRARHLRAGRKALLGVL